MWGKEMEVEVEVEVQVQVDSLPFLYLHPEK